MSFADVDLIDIHVHGLDAEPFYEWLREEAPLYRDHKNELWAVSRYDDVVHVSKHTETFCSRFGVVPTVTLDDWPDEAMINKDGEAHRCQRNLVSKGFTPRRVAELEPRIREMTNTLLDRALDGPGEFDLVASVARPLPMWVISELLGYPPERRDEILDVTDVLVQGGNGIAFVNEETASAFLAFTDFHNELLERRKEQRGDDLISAWLDAELDGERLSEDKILHEHNLLLVGGSETTRHAISGGMYQLLSRPDDVALLRRHPQAIPNAVEEMVRWTTPFVRMQRTLLADHELHGTTMRAGDKILMIYPAANREIGRAHV